MADFQQVKRIATMESVLALLNVPLKKSGEQLRGCCPICGDDNPRAFVVTPAKGLTYCFKCEKGGDQIQLYADVKKLDVKAAAAELEKHFKTEPPETTFEALDYLEPGHPAVAALGIAEDVAKALGAGYAPKGIMRGRVCIPIRTHKGKLVAYLGVNLAMDEPLKFPSKWHF